MAEQQETIMEHKKEIASEARKWHVEQEETIQQLQLNEKLHELSKRIHSLLQLQFEITYFRHTCMCVCVCVVCVSVHDIWL